MTPAQAAYYAVLIAAWNGATTPPAGVNGKSLAGLSTADKIAAVNAWTVTTPVDALLTGGQILGTMDKTEYPSFSTSQYAALAAFFGVQQIDLSPTTANARETIQGILAPWPLSLANLNALLATFDNAQSSWLVANNYPVAISVNDTYVANLT